MKIGAFAVKQSKSKFRGRRRGWALKNEVHKKHAFYTDPINPYQTCIELKLLTPIF